MIATVVLLFAELFVMVFNFLLIVRVIMSYFVAAGNPLYAWLVAITEPLLAPVRRFMPAMPGVDLAPLATFFLLQAAVYLLRALLGAAV
jgi:YggT family protein